jgi:hypothetical protein
MGHKFTFLEGIDELQDMYVGQPPRFIWIPYQPIWRIRLRMTVL